MGKGGAHSFAHRIVSGLDTDLKAGVGLTAEANDEVNIETATAGGTVWRVEFAITAVFE